MRRIGVLILILFCVIGIEVFLIRDIDKGSDVLGMDAVIPTPTVTPVPSTTPTPLPSMTPTPIPTKTPKPTIIPTPFPTIIPQPAYTSQQINELIERFAVQYNVDPNVIRHIAICESGFNPSAVNGPYAGLFQFKGKTWSNSRIQMGEDSQPDLRFNAEEAIQTGAYLISQGKFYLWPNCK